MAEDRLDRYAEESNQRMTRIERNLDRYAEESNQWLARLDRYTEESNQRMTRLERHSEEANKRMTRLERHSEEANKRMTRLEHHSEEANIRIGSAEVTLDRLAELLTRTYRQANERMDRTDKRIAQLSREIGFLLAAIQGHTSQPTPPAHQK